MSKDKPTGYSQSYSQSNFGFCVVKMKNNLFDRRFIDVESNGNVEVKISSSKTFSKEDDNFQFINAELPTDLPQYVNSNESDLNVVAISYKTDKLFVRLKKSSSKCKAFYLQFIFRSKKTTKTNDLFKCRWNFVLSLILLSIHLTLSL